MDDLRREFESVTDAMVVEPATDADKVQEAESLPPVPDKVPTSPDEPLDSSAPGTIPTEDMRERYSQPPRAATEDLDMRERYSQPARGPSEDRDLRERYSQPAKAPTEDRDMRERRSQST